MRMDSGLPKQFIPIAGKPLLMHTVERFYDAVPDIECFLVLPEGHIPYWQELCKEYGFGLPCRLVRGGETRFYSVKNGLKAITEIGGVVAIHDGVRPFPSREMIVWAFSEAKTKGAVVPVLPVTESLRQINTEGSVIADRNLYRLVQTPQTFRLEVLKKAYEQPYSDFFTDDASVVEAMGKEISLIEGNRENIKITHPEDLLWAEVYLKTTKQKS